jgi:hypothetical protein
LPNNEIAEIIKHELGGAYNKDNPVCTIKISSVEIVSNLKEKGISSRKSGKEIPYICSTPKLEKAYIRGLVDGDGYLRNTEFGFGLVGSESICKYVKDFLNNNVVDTTTNSILDHGAIKKFQIGGKIKSSKIIHYLYNNANVYLDRKY